MCISTLFFWWGVRAIARRPTALVAVLVALFVGP